MCVCHLTSLLEIFHFDIVLWNSFCIGLQHHQPSEIYPHHKTCIHHQTVQPHTIHI